MHENPFLQKLHYCSLGFCTYFPLLLAIVLLSCRSLLQRSSPLNWTMNMDSGQFKRGWCRWESTQTETAQILLPLCFISDFNGFVTGRCVPLQTDEAYWAFRNPLHASSLGLCSVPCALSSLALWKRRSFSARDLQETVVTIYTTIYSLRKTKRENKSTNKTKKNRSIITFRQTRLLEREHR